MQAEMLRGSMKVSFAPAGSVSEFGFEQVILEEASSAARRWRREEREVGMAVVMDTEAAKTRRLVSVNMVA